MEEQVMQIINTLFANPAVAASIVVVALLLCKALKASMKVIKFVIIAGLVYIAFSFLGYI